MPTHADLLREMPCVRAALFNRFRWFIHTTSEKNIASIRKTGLEVRKDARPPAEVVNHFHGKNVGPILCLHPLGAMRCPAGAAADQVLLIGADEPPCVTFAIDREFLPRLVGLDWSYEWPRVQNWLNNHPQAGVEEAVLHIATEYGSVASYEDIAPDKLRVFSPDQPPANPFNWSKLKDVTDNQIARYRP
jgi:hypothetical protein